MAISAESITKSSTLEQLRTQFNNLVSDLTALEAGKVAFTEITTTTQNVTTMNVAEDGTIVFEGATNDDNETTLTVADPTADRTITLPDATGTVFLTNTTDSAIFTDKTAISSGDVASGTDVILIADVDASTLKKVTVDNIFSSVGGLTSLAGDSTPQLGGDLDVNSNDIVSVSNGNINLLPNGSGKVIIDGNGSSGGVSITDGVIDIRTGTGNRSKILFYCESSNAHAQTLQAAPHSEAASNTLTLPSTGGSVDLVSTASTATLTNKTLTTPKIVDDGYIQFGSDNEVRLVSHPDKGLILKHTATADDKPVSLTLQTGETDIAADDVIGKLDFQAPDEGTGTDAILVAAGIEAVSEGDFSSSNNATKLSFKTAASAAAAETMSLSSVGVLTLNGGSGAIVVPNDGNIGSASDTDAIAIASGGGVTLSQTSIHSAGLSVKNGATSAGFIEFFEDSDNGTNKVTLIGPASTSDVTLTLPASTDTLAVAGDITALAIALG